MVKRRDDDDLDEHGVRFLVVPYVPFSCPHCGRHKPFTYGVRGRTRLHRCQSCGNRYKSLQMQAPDVHGFEDRTRAQDAHEPRWDP